MVAINNVLVATDFSACAGTALTYGRALARTFGARLHVLHALEPALMTSGADGVGYLGLTPEVETALEEGERAQLQELISDDDRRALRAITSLRSFDTPAHAIVEYAEQQGIDLIVIGTHGRHGLAHMVMGSVAERVVRTAPCPVLTVKNEEHEFVTPDEGIQPAAPV